MPEGIYDVSGTADWGTGQAAGWGKIALYPAAEVTAEETRKAETSFGLVPLAGIAALLLVLAAYLRRRKR